MLVRSKFSCLQLVLSCNMFLVYKIKLAESTFPVIRNKSFHRPVYLAILIIVSAFTKGVHCDLLKREVSKS